MIELRRGATGEAVHELQVRLAAAGFPVGPDEAGRFDAGTEAAVRAFQDSRSLRSDGYCGRETWAALIESGYTLGDRLLYTRRPMLRGDDVLELQRRLNALGFDAGREDGIFGPDTEHAVAEFQLNAGLAADGVVGPSTRAALERLGSLADGSVASVRDREAFRRGARRLAECRVYLATEPGLDALADAIARALANEGAHVVLDPSGRAGSSIAADANRAGADLLLAVRVAADVGPRCTYFANRVFRSEGGLCVATRLDQELTPLLGRSAPPTGRNYALLRETRMAAVVCEPVRRGDAASMQTVVTHAADLGRAFARGVRRGLEEPPDLPADDSRATAG